MSTTVRTEVDEVGVAVVTLDGPSTLNAFSGTTARQLGAALRECDRDDRVRVVVLTGAGRAFCAGADMSPGADPFTVPGDDFSSSPIAPAPWDVRKLVIAAINGPAIGIGLTVALQCDLRIVADDAKLAIPQVRRGMLGDAQSHYTLQRLAGRGVAADLLLTGRAIDGHEAVRIGIANHAVPAEETLPDAVALARDVALHASPASVALSKSILWSDLDLAQTEVAETRAHRVLMNHSDAAEGPAAWQQRRLPRWTFQVSDLPSLPTADQERE